MAGGGHSSGAGTDRWLLTYADLITLLLAFFIIMYAGSKADLEKFSRLARGLAVAFRTAGLQIDTGGTGLLQGSTGLFEFEQLSSERRQFMAISEKLQAYAAQRHIGEHMAVNLRAEGIAITLSNALLFPSGGVELGPESRPPWMPSRN